MKKTENLANNISDFLGISRDIIYNSSRVTVVGGGMIIIEGFLGISEYSDTVISVSSKNGKVSVLGERLTVKSITDEYIALSGNVKSVNFR